ncbi:MAG: DUF4149 domain-containing protein [Gemmatimonadaceae bacterium]|nr:DUF4149 domain-containing protein [Gemmatimonadaceae bacterium]
MTTPPLAGDRAPMAHAGSTLATIVLLAAWLGAAIYFSTAVAQAAFRVLPTRALAGALVGRTLPVIFVAGIVVGVLTAALTMREPAAAWGRAVRIAAELGIALFCAIGQGVIGTRIERLRASIGTTLDALPPGDPARVTFGRLHGLSVLTLALAMLLAIVALVAASRVLAPSTVARS